LRRRRAAYGHGVPCNRGRWPLRKILPRFHTRCRQVRALLITASAHISRSCIHPSAPSQRG
jgi:hypothetical protein